MSVSKPTPTLKRKARKRKQHDLRQRHAKQGTHKPSKQTLPNHNCRWKTPEEETAARQEATENTLQAFRRVLPGLLSDLAKIPDPRNPHKIKHKLTVLLLYGILAFVFQFTSRREAGKEMSRPVFFQNLQALFPELATLPHQDTLCRLLEKIQVDEMEEAHLRMFERLVRQKKFKNYLVNKRYLVAVDGTQKYVTGEQWAEEQLHRAVKEQGDQYYVYVLEAKLVFPDGFVLPLMSVFLDNTVDQVKTKQDCELKAFHRLAAKLNRHFPRLPITLLLDGLYANGPVMAICRKNRWEYMIVLQDGSLPSVWKEANALHKLQPEQTVEREYKGRKQCFWWVNHISYEYGDNGRLKQPVHIVVCKEAWEEVDSDGQVVTKSSRHAWLSSEPLTKKNVHERCNRMARNRWGLENDILKEKHQGYHYEHIFAHEWNAMKGYHYLMHIAHFVNELALHLVEVAELVEEMGIIGFLSFFRNTVAGPWLDLERIRQVVQKPAQMRLAV
jgi:hypothetical protein